MKNPGPIIVINPNSNTDVTKGMDEAVEELRVTGGPDIECITLESGPFGIETQSDIEEVTLPLRNIVRARTDASAFVIACYSDPGLAVCQEVSSVPVFGIQQCGVLAAMAVGDLFGVIALSNKSIQRHMKYLRTMGAIDRLAAELPLDLSVFEAERPEAFEIILETGRALRDKDGAGALILGCAGMARHRKKLAAALGINVIDPVQAATARALGDVLLR